MKVLVLAAGYGTRLKSIAQNKPKPLLEINGRPILDYILDRIRSIEGLDEVIVVTNDKFVGDFQGWVKQQSHFPCDISVVNDGTKSVEERLGSVGDIDYVSQCLIAFVGIWIGNQSQIAQQNSNFPAVIKA